MFKGLAVVLKRVIKDCRNHSMPNDDRKLFPTVWAFTSSTVLWFPCLRNCDGIFPLCSRLPGKWCHLQRRQAVSKDDPANAQGILWLSKSCPSSCGTFPSFHTSPSILILDFIFILFDNESWQNISKVKWRGKGSRLFKRDPPSLLETILFQNGFCYRVGNFCLFLGLLFSGRQVLSKVFLCSQCYIQFLRGFTSPHHAAMVPILSRNSSSWEGCCNRAITSS